MFFDVDDDIFSELLGTIASILRHRRGFAVADKVEDFAADMEPEG